MLASEDLTDTHAREGDFLSSAMKAHHDQSHHYDYGGQHKEGQFLSKFISENKNIVNQRENDLDEERPDNGSESGGAHKGDMGRVGDSRLEKALLTRLRT